MKKLYYTANALLILVLILMVSCKKSETVNLSENTADKKSKKTIEYKKPEASVSYQFSNAKEWLKINEADSSKMNIVYALNRTDKANLKKLDSVVVPSDFSGDLVYYLPFPLHVSVLDSVSKIIIFLIQHRLSLLMKMVN